MPSRCSRGASDAPQRNSSSSQAGALAAATLNHPSGRDTFVSDDDILTKAKVVGGIVYGGMVLGCTHSWRRMRKGGFRFFGRSVCTLITVGIPLGGLYGMKTLYDHGRRCQLETCRYDLKEGNIKSYAKIE